MWPDLVVRFSPDLMTAWLSASIDAGEVVSGLDDSRRTASISPTAPALEHCGVPRYLGGSGVLQRGCSRRIELLMPMSPSVHEPSVNTSVRSLSCLKSSRDASFLSDYHVHSERGAGAWFDGVGEDSFIAFQVYYSPRVDEFCASYI